MCLSNLLRLKIKKENNCVSNLNLGIFMKVISRKYNCRNFHSESSDIE